MNQLDQATILRMVSEGKITPEEGAQLLEALNEAEPVKPAAPTPPPAPFGRPAAAPGKGKFLRVIVKGVADKEKGEEMDVDINVPLKFARKLAPMMENMIPQEAQEKMQDNGIEMATVIALIETLDEDMEGRDLVNVKMGDGEDSMKVRIYVE